MKHIKVEEKAMIRDIISDLGYLKQRYSQYGEMVIATDTVKNKYWRKNFFKNYKENRKVDDRFDWNVINEIKAKLLAVLKKFFPWKVIEIDNAEADDIIAVLTKTFHAAEPILIIAGDGDFKQLQKFPGVKQIDPIRGKQVIEKNPKRFLIEKILKGDRKDGISCVHNHEDDVTRGVRQKAIATKWIDEVYEMMPELYCDDDMLKRFRENEKLLCFDYIPEEVQENIIATYNNTTTKDGLALNYFIKNGMSDMLNQVNKFTK